MSKKAGEAESLARLTRLDSKGRRVSVAPPVLSGCVRIRSDSFQSCKRRLEAFPSIFYGNSAGNACVHHDGDSLSCAHQVGMTRTPRAHGGGSSLISGEGCEPRPSFNGLRIICEDRTESNPPPPSHLGFCGNDIFFSITLKNSLGAWRTWRRPRRDGSWHRP